MGFTSVVQAVEGVWCPRVCGRSGCRLELAVRGREGCGDDAKPCRDSDIEVVLGARFERWWESRGLAEAEVAVGAGLPMMVAMQRRISIGGLAKALQECGRELREFTPAALSRDVRSAHALLNELGDPELLSDEAYRLELARAIPPRVRIIVDQIYDPTRRRVAEAALALHPDYYGTLVGERKKTLVSEEGISADVFRDRRRDALWDIAVKLAQAFPAGWPQRPVVCIAGNYEGTQWDAACRALGSGLAELDVDVTSGYARAGLQVSIAMAKRLEERGIQLGTGQIIQFARHVYQRDHPEGLVGHLHVYGETQRAKRLQMLPGSDVVVLIAGGPGTAEEARLAQSLRIPVIPLTFTGGTARRHGEAMRAAGRPLVLGGHPVDPMLVAQLGQGHGGAGVQAALALIRQVIFASAVDRYRMPGA